MPSGKSTISKLLYPIIAPSCSEGEELLEEFLMIVSTELS
ncbi:hypothetical protein ALNOE001_00570 [Candidatus Methanobinarius endosymbioticus]|uniref:Uncharacterized protein n=1 Tax=Candidatus Methanobinarius endosymbioticus TaxID=2006182 RepID=A0A366MG27_9EURY|nr:hypothetical protein ALNOE001_00570 [Candidatus Methanobinarius endosymbioticus]